ncbi:VOC family protein [Paenibacillus sp. FSL L8-0470]|uniref:VOC family protein n=1 Tax=unclassified Paenibacillus TaxID=185978 RepID=UPI0040473B4F
MSGVLGNHFVTQIGILVNDIEKVSREYADFFGLAVPEIIITDTADIAQTRYNGGVTEARAKLASLQLELIEPDHQPSTWRDYLNEHGEGPHHIAFVIEGINSTQYVLTAAACVFARTRRTGAERTPRLDAYGYGRERGVDEPAQQCRGHYQPDRATPRSGRAFHVRRLYRQRYEDIISRSQVLRSQKRVRMRLYL